VFSETELVDTFLGYAATQEVQYSRDKNPQRFAIVYTTPRRDQSQQSSDLRKAELFVNACRYSGQGDAFLAAESFRQVNQARQSGFVYDYEVLQRFKGVGGDEMVADLRVAAFLVPQAPAFFQTKGQAVALYDYDLTYKRIT
jgi:hypothetical protein